MQKEPLIRPRDLLLQYDLYFCLGDPKEYIVGPVNEKKCPHCLEDHFWTLSETGYFITVFFIPVYRLRKRYWVVCPNCNYKKDIDQTTYKKLIPLAKLNNRVKKGKINEDDYLMELDTLEKASF